MKLTLVADGSSDRALIPLLRWLLERRSTEVFETAWADLRRLQNPPKGLRARIDAALDLHPCDVLVVHRDAERDDPSLRVQEIARATAGLKTPVATAIPVRMTEAWLLFNEPAIRLAVGCPNGTTPLGLPPLKKLEALPDPKELLYSVMREVCGLKGRRRQEFSPNIHRVAELIDDFSPLLDLPSFRALDESLCEALRQLGILLPSSEAEP
jgi:hypothetical protein